MEHQHDHPFQECKDLFELLSQYLDEELPPDTCEQIRSHIAGCAPCVAFVESLKRSVELLHGYGSGETPKPLPEPVRDQLRESYHRMLAARGVQRE